MSVRKFSSASISSVQPKGSKFWNQETFPGTYESISTAIVDSDGASSVSFSNVPQNYAHLQLRIMAKLTDTSNQGGYAGLRFNGDSSSANYTFHRLKGDGSSATAYGAGSGTFDWVVLERLASSHSNIATEEQGLLLVDILDYRNTSKNTTVRNLGGYDSNGTGEILLTSALWLNANAVTSMTLLPSAGNFTQHSHFALYGIRGA